MQLEDRDSQQHSLNSSLADTGEEGQGGSGTGGGGGGGGGGRRGGGGGGGRGGVGGEGGGGGKGDRGRGGGGSREVGGGEGGRREGGGGGGGGEVVGETCSLLHQQVRVAWASEDPIGDKLRGGGGEEGGGGGEVGVRGGAASTEAGGVGNQRSKGSQLVPHTPAHQDSHLHKEQHHSYHPVLELHTLPTHTDTVPVAATTHASHPSSLASFPLQEGGRDPPLPLPPSLPSHQPLKETVTSEIVAVGASQLKNVSSSEGFLSTTSLNPGT